MKRSKEWKILQELKTAIKNEIVPLEDEMYLLEDLKLKERRLGQYEENRAYHRTYCKVLVMIRKLENKHGKS